MKKASNNKKIFIIAIEVIVIVLTFIGVTLATSNIINDNIKVGLKAGDFNVDFKGKSNISFKNLEPISDNLININTKDNVVRVEFSVKSIKQDKDYNIVYDVMMEDFNIDTKLLNEYTKWNLYRNGKLISSGSLSPKFDDSVLGGSLTLTNESLDLPKYNEDYDKYVFILWISESCNDINNCKLVDQSYIANSNLSAKVFVGLYTGTKVKTERISNYDTSCANKPELYPSMVPIYYKDGNVVKANKDNNDLNNLWYDYANKKWANVAIVEKDNYNVGDIIDKNDILAYYVWIPRFKYKVWNINMDGSFAYNAYNNGINIVFENGTNISGNITCDKDKCSGQNLDYYTHPAFINNLKGFWVSKYELSITSGPKFVNGNKPYISSNIEEYENLLNNIPVTYKLGNNLNSGIIKSSEWGSIMYLAHSKYGNMDISYNNSYITGSNDLDSTTGNIYGVYDMAGSASELTYGANRLGDGTYELLDEKDLSWTKTYHGSIMGNNYYIRGGLDNGIYYFGSMNEGSYLVSVRNTLTKKSS